MRPTPRALLLWAGGCAALFVVLLTVAYASDAARRVDASALTGFVDLERPAASGVTARLGALADPLGVAVIGAGLAAVALARGRPRAALAVLAVLGATSVSSQVLKSVLAYPRYEGLPEDLHISPAAFPSGHATAAMALALAAVLVAPRRARPLAAFVGLGFALAVSFSVLVQGWHFPSDVVGGYLLAAGWTFAVAAALLAAPARFPERTARSRAAFCLRRAIDRAATVGLVAAALAGTAVLGVAALVIAVTRRHALIDYAHSHTALVFVAAAVVVSAGALLVMATAALGRRE